MTRRRLLLASICSPALLPAADPWKDKKAADWNSKDATRILTNSPWAKTVSAEMDMARMGGGGPGGGGMGGPAGGGMGGPPGGGGGGMGGPPGGGGGMGGPPPGGMGGPDGGMATPKFLVRWESAVPVREAAAKTEDVNGAKLSELSKEFYVVSTSGNAMMPGGRRRDAPDGSGGPNDAPRPQQDLSRMRERMLQTSSLRIKGRDPIAPVKVEMLQNGRGMTMLFLFPRSAEFGGDAKEASFETSIGPMMIKAKFSLKDMIYAGRPAL